MYNVISAQKLMRGEKVPWNFPVLAFDFDQKDNQKLKINLKQYKTKLTLFDAPTATTQAETGNSLNST